MVQHQLLAEQIFTV